MFRGVLFLSRAAGGATSGDADWEKALAGWAERQALGGKRPLLELALPALERILIRAALQRTQGHRQEAAKLLGWGRNTLTRKLKELGMAEEEATAPGEEAEADNQTG